MSMCCLYVVYGHLSSSACMSMSSDGLIHSAVGISQHKTRDPSTVCFEPSTFGPSPSIHLYRIPGGARPRSMEGFLRGCCTALYESGPRPSARVLHLPATSPHLHNDMHCTECRGKRLLGEEREHARRTPDRGREARDAVRRRLDRAHPQISYRCDKHSLGRPLPSALHARVGAFEILGVSGVLPPAALAIPGAINIVTIT